MPPTQAVGSGKVTDTQVAFMVECYLRDNNFNKTLEEFRSEAATVLHPLRSVPKGARSLHSVLNEYVALKEEHIRVEAEKARVDDLFRGLQDIVSSYQSGFAPTNSIAAKQNLCSPSVGTTTPRLLALASQNDDPASVKEKVSLKRKNGGSSKVALANSATSNENSFPHGNTSADASKKARHSLTANSNMASPPPQGDFLRSPSYTTKTAQPATPPMSSSLNNVNPIHNEFQHHPTPMSSQGLMSTSPLQNCMPTVSRHQQASKIFSPGRLPTQAMLQQSMHHTGPRTPPAANSSASSSSASPHSAAPPSSCADTVTKASSRQHPRRSSRNQAPCAQYSTRAQKKLDSSSADVLKDSDTANKASKKSGNSKCRLLDFSSAESDPKYVAIQATGNFQDSRSSSSNCQTDGSQTVITDANSNTKVSPVSETVQPHHVAEGPTMVYSGNPLPCDDNIFFDDMFEFEIDTNLISELQDLAPLENEISPPSQAPAIDSTVSHSPSVAPDENKGQGVLTEATNVTHSDGTFGGSVCASPPASGKPKALSDGTNLIKCSGSLNGSPLAPSNSKNRKFVIRGGEVLISDKENLPAC